MAEVGKRNQIRRRKRRGGNKTLYYILFILILLTTGVALSLTVLFKIEFITAIGADKYPPDKIVAESGISVGDNLFRVNSAGVRDKLMAEFPYIEDVDVRHRLPSTILLEITQCKPCAAISDGSDFLIITRQGKVLERGVLFIPENIPLIKGIDTEKAKPGEMLGDNAADALLMLDYLFSAVEETDFNEITNVDLSDIYNMKIIYENRLLLKLGTEASLAAKLNFVKEMIDNRLPPDAQGLIDASDIGRSLIYTEMTIEEAESGKKYTPKKTRELIQQDKLDEESPENTEDADETGETETGIDVDTEN